LLKQLCISLFLEQNLHSSRKRKIMKMVAIYLFLFAISQFPTGIAQQGDSNSTVSLDSSLSPNNNSYWLSSSRQFAFGFYKIENGFAIGIWFEKIQQKTVIWTANRDDPPLPKDVTLLLNNNGRLVLQSKDGQQTSLVNAPVPASSASIPCSILETLSSTVLIQGSYGRVLVFQQTPFYPVSVSFQGTSLSPAPLGQIMQVEVFNWLCRRMGTWCNTR
jgi:hypothetical protein